MLNSLFTGDQVIADKCTVKLQPSDWNETSHEATTTFKVLATRDFKLDGDQITLVHFEDISSGDVPPIFNGYTIPYLQVSIAEQLVMFDHVAEIKFQFILISLCKSEISN